MGIFTIYSLALEKTHPEVSMGRGSTGHLEAKGYFSCQGGKGSDPCLTVKETEAQQSDGCPVLYVRVRIQTLSAWLNFLGTSRDNYPCPYVRSVCPFMHSPPPCAACL